MQWLHNFFGQAKDCILDLAVLVLFCIGILRIVLDDLGRLRPAPKNRARGTAAPPRNGDEEKPKIAATPEPRRPRSRPARSHDR